MGERRVQQRQSLLVYDRLLHSISTQPSGNDIFIKIPDFGTASFEQKLDILHKHVPSIPVPQSNFFPHCKEGGIEELRVDAEEPCDGLGDSFDDEIWKCEGVGMQPIVELPAEYSQHFGGGRGPGAAADFYMSMYKGATGVWYAVLFALDSEFVMRTFQTQQNCVVTLKQQMNSELDVHYTKHKYRQFGYSKADMHRVLMNADTYHVFMGHYLSDFLQLNIAVLLPNQKYHWLGRYDEGRTTVCLYHKGTDWCPVVHADGKSHIFSDLRCLDGLEHLEFMDSSKQHLNLNMDKATLAILKREIKAMKLRELQDRAVSLELLIHDAYGKQKLKGDLQKEVYVQMTGCESM